MFGADNTEEVQHRNTELVTTLLICMFVGCGEYNYYKTMCGQSRLCRRYYTKLKECRN